MCDSVVQCVPVFGLNFTETFRPVHTSSGNRSTTPHTRLEYGKRKQHRPCLTQLLCGSAQRRPATSAIHGSARSHRLDSSAHISWDSVGPANFHLHTPESRGKSFQQRDVANSEQSNGHLFTILLAMQY